MQLSLKENILYEYQNYQNGFTEKKVNGVEHL